jgi:capsid protein
MSNKFDLISYIKQYSVLQGSPETTFGKQTTDGKIESYGDFATRSRRDINYHLFNGTDIPTLATTFANGVIGETVNIQARTDKDKINTQFENLIKEHSCIENFDITESYGRDEAFWASEYFKFLNGGIIIRNHYNTKWDIPYKVELVGVDMIDTSKSRKWENILNGLHTDKYGKVIGVYLFDDYEKSKSSYHSTKDMIICSPKWMSLSQRTAVSKLVSVLQKLDSSIIYDNEEIKAAIARAKTGVYWHTELFSELQNALSEKLKEYDTDERVVEIREVINSLASRGLGASGATPTPKEDTITQLNNKTDSTYKIFNDKAERSISSAVGMNPTTAYKDPEKGNYSSLKLMVSMSDNDFKVNFRRFKETFAQMYLKNLFRVGVQTKRIDLASSLYFNNPQKYHQWDIMRTVKIVIDETKEATARDKNLQNGSTTQIKEYAARGLDYITEQEKQIDADIALEKLKKQKYEKAGLAYPGVTNEE